MGLAGGRHYWWAARRVLIRAGAMKPPANRLRNADFSLCTNPRVPDYWGTNDAAKLGGIGDVLWVDAPSPIPGTRSLRLHGVQSDTELSILSALTFVPEPRSYVVSAYVKSDGRCEARLSLGWGKVETFSIGPEWRRVHVSHEPRSEAQWRAGLGTRFSLAGEGTLWIAAPQLEQGATPTPFARALMDDHPLPMIPWGGDEEWDGGQRAVVVNGMRRFVTVVALEHPNGRQLKDVADRGFDAVAVFVPAEKAEEEAAEILGWFDEAARHGLRVLPFLSPGEVGSVARLTASVVRRMRRLKTHPGVLGWVILDEPNRLWPVPPWDDLATLYRAARDEDPARLVITNDNAWQGGADPRLDVTDVGSVDIYPVGQYANSLKLVADLSARMNQSCARTGKPTAMWLQMYGSSDAVREPTPDEERAMSYATLIHGTSMLCYWIYRPMNDALWTSMRDLNDEVRRLEPVMCSSDSRCVKVGIQRGRVHYTLWEHAGRAYLVVCNISSVSVMARLDTSADGTSRRVSRAWYGDSVHLQVGDRLWAWLPPLGRQVWELAAR